MKKTKKLKERSKKTKKLQERSTMKMKKTKERQTRSTKKTKERKTRPTKMKERKERHHDDTICAANESTTIIDTTQSISSSLKSPNSPKSYRKDL